ncbi:putative leucine-rich repeat-containing protein DDB_G0290503 [Parasteatoda tepidariorum]|uniref:putative leucine-rich repeat-containing protein DDB_G0290503 n=1 Tax=Parasteatoda tepidariorum TaxID=114398 RepID=UPI001C71E7D4|nr:uncharacterized protein LOC107438974 [Parasteatoda tepidariorum]
MSKSDDDLKNEESKEEYGVVESDSSEYSCTGIFSVPSIDDLLSTIDRSIIPEEGSLSRSDFRSASISSTQQSSDTIPKEPNLSEFADVEILEKSESSKFDNPNFPEHISPSNFDPSEDHLEADFGFINMKNNKFASSNKSRSISSHSNFSECKVSSDSQTDVLSILIDETDENLTINNSIISNQDILSLVKPFKIVLNRLTKEELTIYGSVSKQNDVVCTLETSLFPYDTDDSDVISKSDNVRTNKKKKISLTDSSEEGENRLETSTKKLHKSTFKKVLKSGMATNELSSLGIKQKKNKHKDLPSAKQKKYSQKRGRPKKLTSFEPDELSETEKETAVDNLQYKNFLHVAEDSDNTSDDDVSMRLSVEKINRRKLSSTGEDVDENEEKNSTKNITSKLTSNKSIKNQTATSENLEKARKDQLKKLFFSEHETRAETKKKTVFKTYRSRKLSFNSGTDDSDINSSASDIEEELPDEVKKLTEGIELKNIELPINKKVMKTKSKFVKSYALTASKLVFTRNPLPNFNYKENVSENETSANDLCSTIKPCRVVLYKLSEEEINFSKLNNSSNEVHKTKTLLCAKGGSKSNVEASNGFSYSSEKPIFKSLKNRKLSASTESSRKSCESTDSSLPSIPILDKLFSKNRRYGKLKSSVKQSQQKSSSMAFFKASPDKNGNEDGLCIPLTSDVDISEESENESKKAKLLKKKSHQKSSSKMATQDKDENAKSLYTQDASDIDSSEESEYESKKPESLKKKLHQKSSSKKSTAEKNTSAKSFDTSHTSNGEISEESEHEDKKPDSFKKKLHQKSSLKKAAQDKDVSKNLDTLYTSDVDISEEFELESKKFESSKKKSHQKSSSKMASENKDANAKSLYTKTASDVDSSEHESKKLECSKKNLHQKSSSKMITQKKFTRTKSLNSPQASDVDIFEESEHEGKKPKSSKKKSHQKSLFKNAAEDENSSAKSLDSLHASDIDSSEESEYESKKPLSFEKKSHRKTSLKKAAEDKNSSTESFNTPHTFDVDISEESQYEDKKSESFKKKSHQTTSLNKVAEDDNSSTKSFNTPHTSDVDISEESEHEDKKSESFKKKSHQKTSLRKAAEDDNSSTKSFHTPHTSDVDISEESEHKGKKLESSKKKLHIISSTKNVSQDKDMSEEGLLTDLTSDVDIFEESENEIIKSGKNLVSLMKPCKVILNKINVSEYFIVKEPSEKQNVLNNKRIISSSDEESDALESLSTSNLIKTNKRARLVTSSNVTGIHRMRGKINKKILLSGRDDRITVKNASTSKNQEIDNSKTLSYFVNCIEKVYKTHKKRNKGIVSSDDDEIISVKSTSNLEKTNAKIVLARQSSPSSINSVNEISEKRGKEMSLSLSDDSVSFKNKLTFKQSKTNIGDTRVRLKSSSYINNSKKIHKTSRKRKNISSSEEENINLQPTSTKSSSDRNHRRSSSCSSVDISSSIEKAVNKNSVHPLQKKRRFVPKEKVGEKFSSNLKHKRLSLTQICDTNKDSDKDYQSDIDELVETGHKKRRHVNTKTISRSSSSSSKLKHKRLSLNSETKICDTNKDSDKDCQSDIDELVDTGHKKKRHVNTKTISRSSSSSSLSSSASIKTVPSRSDEQSMTDKGFSTSKLKTEKTFVSNLKRKRSVSNGCLNSNLNEDSGADLKFKGKNQRRPSSVSSENSFMSVETASSKKLTVGCTSSISSSDGISHEEFESDFLGKLKKDKASKLKRTMSSETKNRKSCIPSHFKAKNFKMKITRDNELLSLITPCQVILHRLPDNICFENWTRKDSDFLRQINALEKSLSVGENYDSCNDLNFFEKTSLVCAEPELLRNKNANSDTRLSATIELSKATLSDSSSDSEQSYEESRYYKEFEKEKIFEQADLALGKQNNQEENSITSESEILCDKNIEQSYKELKNFETSEMNKKNSDLTDATCENQADNSIISGKGGTQYDQDAETDKNRESHEIDVNNAKGVIQCCEVNKNKEIENEPTGLGNYEIQCNVNDKKGNKGLNNLANLEICSCETNQKEENNRSDDRLTNKKSYDELTNLAKEDIACSNANGDVEGDIELTKNLAKEVNECVKADRNEESDNELTNLAKEVNECSKADRNEESDNELSILAKEDIECSKEDRNEESDNELINEDTECSKVDRNKGSHNELSKLAEEDIECNKANRIVESDIELTNLAKEDIECSKVDRNEESDDKNDSELTNLNCVKMSQASENLVSCEKKELQSVKTNINDENSRETSYKLKHSSCETNYEQNDSFIGSNIETQSSVPDKNCQTDKEMTTISCDRKCDSKNSQVNLDKLKNLNSKIQEGPDSSLIAVAKKGVKKKQKKNKFTSLERQLMAYANLQK